MTDPIAVDQTQPSAEALVALNCLREAVAEALERKRRLGQYAVHWTPDGPRCVGADAPVTAGRSQPE